MEKHGPKIPKIPRNSSMIQFFISFSFTVKQPFSWTFVNDGNECKSMYARILYLFFYSSFYYFSVGRSLKSNDYKNNTWKNSRMNRRTVCECVSVRFERTWMRACACTHVKKCCRQHNRSNRIWRIWSTSGTNK